MKVHLFHRAPGPGFHSIEAIFTTLEPQLAQHCEVANFHVPRPEFSPSALLANIRYASRHVGQVNHITGHVHYLALGLRKNVVLTVHDTRSSLAGRGYEVLLKKALLYWLPARFVKRITAVSEQTKGELQALLGGAQAIDVVPNPYSPLLTFKPKAFPASKPTVLHLGTTPNKNLARTIQALARIPCRLVIVGRPSPPEQQILDEAAIEYETHSDVPFSRIVELYERCDLVSFVSTYEGFGMPIIEGQVVGRPIVTSNLTPMKEVAGGAAVLVDPDDVRSIRDGFQKVIESESLRAELVSRGARNARRFHPETIARAYLQIYREVLAARTRPALSRP